MNFEEKSYQRIKAIVHAAGEKPKFIERHLLVGGSPRRLGSRMQHDEILHAR